MSYFDFQSVARYIQSEDVLKEFKRHIIGKGKNILIITACSVVTETVVKQITESFNSPITSQIVERFDKENHKYKTGLDFALKEEEKAYEIKFEFIDYDPIPLTVETATELAELIRDKEYDLVVGIGGGKALDIVRAAKHLTLSDFSIALVPTAASTNASVTNLSIIYNKECTRIMHYWALRECQEMVLADPKLIIGAPIRTLSAGMGDVISTFYEALNWSKRTNRQDFYSISTWEYIKTSIEIMLKYGPEAYEAAKRKEITHEYESIVSLILYSTGIIRNGCLSGVGHLIDEGLLALEPCRKFMHGELVGYGVIPMMVFDNEPDEVVYRYIDFCKAVHIPTSLAELGIPDITDEELELVCDTIENGTVIQSFQYPISKSEFKKMILDADKIVTEYSSK